MAVHFMPIVNLLSGSRLVSLGVYVLYAGVFEKYFLGNS